jgi:hypothetical protein
MNSYKFKYRKLLIKKTINAIGHKFSPDLNRMDVYHVDGSITSIANWSKYDLFLGTDWVLFTKKQMEKEAGQKIDLAVGA